jgi:dihydrofolate reductase
MRKVVLSMFVTLDGLISGPKGELDWMPGNQKPDQEVDSYIYEMMDEMDTMLLGGKTYQLFVDYWPTATTDEELIADKLNAMPKVVFSGVPEVNWGKWDNARLARGTLAEEINGLRQQSGKNMVMFGGASLAQSCMELGLIDVFRLFVTPIILGSGKPLFRSMKNKIDLRLLDTRTFRSGTVLLSYIQHGPTARASNAVLPGGAT